MPTAAILVLSIMGFILRVIIVITIFAGTHSRLLAADPCDVVETMHQQESGKMHECPANSSTPCKSNHDDTCPVDHHHHGSGCFCPGNPLMNSNDGLLSLITPCYSLLRLTDESGTAPDGPFLSEDKPPLI